MSGTRSLEYRLRDASSIRTLLISLLEDLDNMILAEGKYATFMVYDRKLRI